MDDENKLRFEGPAVRPSPNAAISLAMALHELGTNALKHGALSAANGYVKLFWELADGSEAEEGRLHVVWSEYDGPEVRTPSRKGFGRRMLEQGIAHELGGDVELDYDAAGLTCRMSFPAAQVLGCEHR